MQKKSMYIGFTWLKVNYTGCVGSWGKSLKGNHSSFEIMKVYESILRNFDMKAIEFLTWEFIELSLHWL